MRAFFCLPDTISKSLWFFFKTKAQTFPPLWSVLFGPTTHSLWCCNLRLLGVYWPTEWTNHAGTPSRFGLPAHSFPFCPFPVNILNDFNTPKKLHLKTLASKFLKLQWCVWPFLSHCLTSYSSIGYSELSACTFFEIALAKVTDHFPFDPRDSL